MSLFEFGKFKKEKVHENYSVDPITSETEKKKRNLIVIGSLCLLSAVFDVKMSSAILSVNSEAASSSLSTYIVGISAIILVFSCISYALHALSDFKRWDLSQELFDLMPLSKMLIDRGHMLAGLPHIEQKLATSIHELKVSLSRIQVSLDNYNGNALDQKAINQLRNVTDGMMLNLLNQQIEAMKSANFEQSELSSDLKKWIHKFQARHKNLHSWVWIKIWILDYAMPFGIAIYAGLKVGSGLFPVMEVIWNDWVAIYSSL